MPKSMPRNPRDPKPEFVTGDKRNESGKLIGIVYGWKADKSGILAFGNTEAEAIRNWHENYQAEYFG